MNLKNNKKIAIIISPNYKDYAKRYSVDCITSIRKQKKINEFKIFITDNESTEESFTYLKKIAPEVEIIRNEKNDGFAKGNNDAIKVAIAQGFDYFALFNLDTILDENCIAKMIEVMENPSNPFYQGGSLTIGAAQARLMLWPDKDKINSIGNVTHFLGFGYSDGYKEKFSIFPPMSGLRRINNFQFSIKEICYPSGAGVLFTREVLEKIGLLDEEFWMYAEDQDIGWRIWLAGYKCVLVPEAIVYHKYEFSRSIEKYYWMDRNRIIVMLKNYHWASLVLIFPAFLLMEIGLFIFACGNGWLKEKIKVYKYFLNLKNWKYILNTRKQTQSLRKVRDKDIIKIFSGKIWYQEIGDWKLKIANIIFNTYWNIIKKLIIW